MKEQLLNGETLSFSNEHECTDDIRTCEAWFFEDGKNQWKSGFKIWFNGKLIHSSKTFAPMQKRLNTLCKDWNLKPIHNQ